MYKIKHLNNSADDKHTFYETIASLISIFITERSSNLRTWLIFMTENKSSEYDLFSASEHDLFSENALYRH